MKEIKIKRTESIIHKTLANILQNEQTTINNTSILITIINIIYNKTDNQIIVYIKIFPKNIKYILTNKKLKLYKKKLSSILRNSIRKIPKMQFIILK